jgi:glucose/mannose transport system substrate-binding protein
LPTSVLAVKGEAAGNIHGDWLQGDLQVLGGVPGENYSACWRSASATSSGGGDSFFFPKLPEGTDQAVIDAQTALAKVVIGKKPSWPST